MGNDNLYALSLKELHPQALVILQSIAGAFDLDESVAFLSNIKLDQVWEAASMPSQVKQHMLENGFQILGGDAVEGQR